jgi:uncharacterized integral membrane protein
MIRKIVTALILIPVAIVLIAFAVANRDIVTVSLDPFDRADPGLAISMPLFALIIVLVIAGVVIGGLAAWLRQGKWRWRARHFEGEARELRSELDRIKRRTRVIGGPIGPLPGEGAPPLSIPPPAG